MRARTEAYVRGDGTLGRLSCQPPLTLRRVGTDDGWTGLCLVGSAAGPLPGDDLALDLGVAAGARVRLTASGASIAQGRRGEPAALAMTAGVGDAAALDADPGPLVVGAGADVDVTVRLDLAATATLRWSELVVLGRHVDARPGRVTLRWDVTRAGRPVLRQLTDLADPALRDWPGMTGGNRVLAATLFSGPDLDARTIVASPAAVAQRVDPHTVLVTVLAQNAAAAGATLAGLLARCDAAAALR